MLRNKKEKYAIIPILLTVLMLLLTQCQSCPEPETVIVEKTILPPEINFPVPPDPAGRVQYLDNGDVKIDAELWLQFAEYMIDVDATRQKYEAIREEYKDTK